MQNNIFFSTTIKTEVSFKIVSSVNFKSKTNCIIDREFQKKQFYNLIGKTEEKIFISQNFFYLKVFTQPVLVL